MADIKFKQSNNWQSVAGILFPIGFVWSSYEDSSPANLFTVIAEDGEPWTWTAITGRFPYYNAGTATGGSNNLIVPYHNHTGSFTGTQASLTHTAHKHKIVNNDNYALITGEKDGMIGQTKVASGSSSTNKFLYDNSEVVQSSIQYTQDTTVSAHTYTPAGSITVNYAGSSGNTTNANMPAYQTLYAWRRTH